ncbi:hypothetical protein [Sphingomonas lenta]|uniref:Sugar transporter n=1 Tax=Sphingomonas lenta TaxID=1141887 RepID=A0A2A2SG56_9SPHN|nr:hypothetical protein [Sphingomonas lenta]PAX08246.1 hypothetical protein CKY28_11835 [Sphingomonas lenta]
MTAAYRRAPAWFRVVAALLLVWGVAGCYACFQQFRLGADAMGPATDYDRTLYASLPIWYDPLYAVATSAGLLGALALLARSRLALPLFALSLFAVLVQFGYLFAASDLVATKGAAATLPFPIFIALVAAGATWLSARAMRRGWIG